MSTSLSNPAQSPKTPILDLPNEIFNHILHYAREENGADGLIPLRFGCRFLRDKVDDIIFIETSVAELKTAKYIGYMKSNVEGYLFGQTLRLSGTDVQPELPAIVHKMTDYLRNALAFTTAEDRMSYQKRLCVDLCHYYGRGCILRLVWSRGAVTMANLPNSDSSNLPDAYKRLASILSGAYHLRDDLWIGKSLFIPTFNSDRTTPLAYAVSIQNTALLELVMEYGINNNLVSLNVQDALDLALKRSRADFACKILSVTRPSDRLQKHRYIRLLDLASPLANPRHVSK